MIGQSDTDPKMRALIIERIRAMTPLEKLQPVGQLNRAVLSLAAARQRSWYPDDTPDEARIRLASLWIERDLMIKWFGWDPNVKGR